MARIRALSQLNKPTESEEQMAFFEWVKLHPNLEPFIIHIANERKCSFARGKMLKKMGVRAGVADIFVMIPAGKYHGLWIEMKVLPNKPTESQLTFLEHAKSKGYKTSICYSCDEAIYTLKKYLKFS